MVEWLSKTCNFSPGLSDVHNMIARQLKVNIPLVKKNGVIIEVLEILM